MELKNCEVLVKGTQLSGEEEDTQQLTCRGKLSLKDGGFTLYYKDDSGEKAKTVTLKYDGRRLKMSSPGGTKAEFFKNETSEFLYCVQGFTIALSAHTHEISAGFFDSGIKIRLEYTLMQGDNTISENTLTISAREKENTDELHSK